jgi:hypothetical protein
MLFAVVGVVLALVTPPSAVPPPTYQCDKAIIHHTVGCFNDSDWKVN